MPAWFVPMSFVVTVALVLAELVIARRRVAAVKGSRQRYALTTVYRINAWAFVAVLTIFTIASLAGGFLFAAACDAALTGLRIWFAVRVTNNTGDDDWFTGRGRKIKNAVRRRLTSRRTTAATNAA